MATTVDVIESRRSFVCHFLAATRGNKGRGTKHETKSNPAAAAAATGERARGDATLARESGDDGDGVYSLMGTPLLLPGEDRGMRPVAMGIADARQPRGKARGRNAGELPVRKGGISSSFLFHFRGKLGEQRNHLPAADPPGTTASRSRRPGFSGIEEMSRSVHFPDLVRRFDRFFIISKRRMDHPTPDRFLDRGPALMARAILGFGPRVRRRTISKPRERFNGNDLACIIRALIRIGRCPDNGYNICR